MAIISFPSTLCPVRWSMRVEGNVWANQSPMNKAVSRVESLGGSWMIEAEFAKMTPLDFRPIRAFFNQFRGPAHTLRVWDLAHPAPYGTMRGTPTLAAAATDQATSVQITGTGTLIAGDMLGITLANGLIQLVEAVTVTGTAPLTVTINPPLRRAANSGASVKWDKPTIDVMILNPPMFTDMPGMSDGFSFQAIERPMV